MGRPFKGEGSVAEALKIVKEAKSVEQLRQAQAVVLPLCYGLNLEQTAAVIGVSLSWASRLRNAFLAGHRVGGESEPARGGRHRENFTRAQEAELLKPFFDQAAKGGILVVSQIKPALEKALGRPMALSSAYNVLHRNGWRKLAPDKRHPQSDPTAQGAWKKLPDTLGELRRDFAKGTPIRLMFQDEARFGRNRQLRGVERPYFGNAYKGERSGF